MKYPQEKVYNIHINSNQLDHMIKAFELLVANNHMEETYDEQHVFYVSPEQTLELLKGLQISEDAHLYTNGLCL